MNLGPYKISNNKISYKGNKFYKAIPEICNIKPPAKLKNRHLEVKHDSKKWESLIILWDGIFKGINEFMERKNVLLFDLPITTRMISSPGALTGTISSDVEPFEVNFFNKKTYLTQSSQLYLEFAITNPKINSVYCWEKSFRKEKADFRHLPEFMHVEFESNICFKENLKFQKDFIQFLIKFLIKNYTNEIYIFLNEKDIKDLDKFSKISRFETITFNNAFKLLKQKTENNKYNNITIKNFCAYDEILLTELIKQPLFITNFIEDEVAFYHSKDQKNKNCVINADFLYPGYGELIGSGERVHTREETRQKARHFKLNYKDYQPYIESRDLKNIKIHSGWGMGIERFIQAVFKLPFIWETKVFPRIDNYNYP